MAAPASRSLSHRRTKASRNWPRSVEAEPVNSMSRPPRGVRLGDRRPTACRCTSVGSDGKRQWQPESRQHAVVEAGHGADAITGQGQDEESGPVARSGRSPNIGTKSKLTVRPHRRHEVVGPAACAEDAGGEASHNVEAHVVDGEEARGSPDVVPEEVRD